MLVYVHGFRSSGQSSKAQVLSNHFGAHSVKAPDLPASPEEALKLVEEIVKESSEPVLLVGSSLGGFYSLVLAANLNITAVLINPSLRPWQTLADGVGWHKLIHSDDDFEWKQSYNDHLAQCGKMLEDTPPFDERLHFFLAEDDELLDHSSVPQLFPNAATLVYFSKCTHRFLRFEEIIDKIAKIYGGL